MSTVATSYNVMKCLETFKGATSNGPDQIDLAKFSVGYREFIKFFDFLGKVFGFVKSDLVDKLDTIDREILQEKLDNGGGVNVNYVTVHGAVEYEKNVGKDTATVAILRLMRGLDFIRRFLEGLYKNQDTNKKPYDLALAAYEQTLAFRHTWTVRQLVKAGLCILPSKKNLIVYMYTGVQASNTRCENDAIFQDVLEQFHKVYSSIHKLYEKHDFLELVPV